MRLSSHHQRHGGNRTDVGDDRVESKVAFVHGAQGSMNVERSVVVHINLTVTARAFGRPVLMPELEGRTLQSVAELEEVLELVR